MTRSHNAVIFTHGYQSLPPHVVATVDGLLSILPYVGKQILSVQRLWLPGPQAMLCQVVRPHVSAAPILHGGRGMAAWTWAGVETAAKF